MLNQLDTGTTLSSMQLVNFYQDVIFEVFTRVIMKNAVF
jgi:hypothetical protein